MTIESHRSITPLQLAKALHPASGRPREPQHDERSRGSGARATTTGAGAGVLAVLWQESVCRARLRSVVQAWLSCPGHQGRLPMTIAAVEGDDVLLVGRVTPDVSGIGPGRTAELEVGGVGEGSRRWTVRASGLLQTVVPGEPSRPTGHRDRTVTEDAPSSDTGEFAVLALTINSIRGFETGRQPASS